jgi:hypothetical protein
MYHGLLGYDHPFHPKLFFNDLVMESWTETFLTQSYMVLIYNIHVPKKLPTYEKWISYDSHLPNCYIKSL